MLPATALIPVVVALPAVAVCLGGSLRALQQTAPGWVAHVLEPLSAEAEVHLFVYGPVKELAGAALDMLSPYLAAVHVERENVTAQILKDLEDDSGEVLDVLGNWLGGLHLQGQHARWGSGLYQMRSLWWCSRMMRDTEISMGASFERVICSRPEILWIGDHPPLRWLDPDIVWIPDGEDHGGLNDRHAVLNRVAAEHYMGGWSSVVDGTALKLIQEAVGSRAAQLTVEDWGKFGMDGMSTEVYLALRLVGRYKIARFPPTYYVVCTNAHPRKNITVVEHWQETAVFDRFSLACAPGGPKYRNEFEDSVSFLSCGLGFSDEQRDAMLTGARAELASVSEKVTAAHASTGDDSWGNRMIWRHDDPRTTEAADGARAGDDDGIDARQRKPWTSAGIEKCWCDGKGRAGALMFEDYRLCWAPWTLP
mmetsp:Transcript_57774/g.154347  ORF Transcript_57774/g.154347 Transcript_57774/m.154347 type:complete len:423 (+) Transcript_57774:129-1397(+)